MSTAPPTIVFFVNDPALFTDNYQRFLERKIRDALNFEGIHMTLHKSRVSIFGCCLISYLCAVFVDFVYCRYADSYDLERKIVA